MSKKEVVSCLEKNGYSAELRENIPIVRIGSKTEMKKVHEMLMTIGYRGSYGFAILKN